MLVLTSWFSLLNLVVFFHFSLLLEMPEIKLKQPTSVVSAETNKQTGKHFYNHMKPKLKKARTSTFVPPRDGSEFSANWKGLLTVSICDIASCAYVFTRM